MRLETQRQIVKAFAMMYEDTEMPLSELISKLQQLNGNGSDRSKKELAQRSSISDKQILSVFTPGKSFRVGEILKALGETKKDKIAYQLIRLVNQNKINKVKLNPKLCEYSLV